MDVNFRKIDIDAFDEENLRESDLYEEDPRGPDGALDEAKQKQVAVRSALARFAQLVQCQFKLTAFSLLAETIWSVHSR